jgi:hypothetical protein
MACRTAIAFLTLYGLRRMAFPSSPLAESLCLFLPGGKHFPAGFYRKGTERGRSMRLSCSQGALASQCNRRFSQAGCRSAGRLRGWSLDILDRSARRVARGRSPRVSWGGDLRATAQKMSCTPAGVPDPAGQVTWNEGPCRRQVVAAVSSPRFWHPSPGCSAIRRRSPVVVPLCPERPPATLCQPCGLGSPAESLASLHLGDFALIYLRFLLCLGIRLRQGRTWADETGSG